MVFENLTLFEITLERAQIGPRSMSDDDAAIDGEAAASTGRRARFTPLFVLAVLAIGAGVLWRRFRKTDAEVDVESEAAEADLAAAQ